MSLTDVAQLNSASRPKVGKVLGLNPNEVTKNPLVV